MPVSAEGRVENQKLNETAALLSFVTVFGFQLDSLEKKLTILPGFTFTLWTTLKSGFKNPYVELKVRALWYG